MEMITLLPVLLSLIVIGAFAGFLAGLLGVGGGIVLAPDFLYVFQYLGLDGPQLMQVCLATSLATIIVTLIRSTQSHHKMGAVDWLILRQWAPGIAIGAVCGVALAANLESLVLQLIFGGLGVVIGLYLAFGNQAWSLADDMLSGALCWVLGPILGGLSVLLGIGGGSLGVHSCLYIAYLYTAQLRLRLGLALLLGSHLRLFGCLFKLTRQGCLGRLVQ